MKKIFCRQLYLLLLHFSGLEPYHVSMQTISECFSFLFRCCVGLFPKIAVLKSDIRGGGKTGKKAVEQSYSVVLSALILQLGSCHGLSGLDHQDNSRCTYKFNNPSST